MLPCVRCNPELGTDPSPVPQTSTPAFTGAAPPRPPLTAARTLPNFARIPNPVLPAPSMPLADAGGKGMAVYQSSEVMATIPVVVKKKRKDEWDDSSQETLESLRKAAVEGDEEEEEEDLPETEVVQEESLAATDPDGEASTSMSLDRTAGAEEDMSLDSRVETPRASAVQLKNFAAGFVAAAPSEAVKEDETQDSLATSNAASAPPAHQPSPGSLASSTALRRKRSAGETPLFAPDVDSQSQSINGDLEESHDTRQTMNLTDIGLMSSQADQTQIEVEGTQVEYDVERLAPVSVSGDLSVGSKQLPFPHVLHHY